MSWTNKGHWVSKWKSWRQETESLHQSWQASITLGFDWLRRWSRLCRNSDCHHSNDDLKWGVFSPGEVVYVLRMPWISFCLLNQALCVCMHNESNIHIPLAVVKVLSRSICWAEIVQVMFKPVRLLKTWIKVVIACTASIQKFIICCCVVVLRRGLAGTSNMLAFGFDSLSNFWRTSSQSWQRSDGAGDFRMCVMKEHLSVFRG